MPCDIFYCQFFSQFVLNFNLNGFYDIHISVIDKYVGLLASIFPFQFIVAY